MGIGANDSGSLRPVAGRSGALRPFVARASRREEAQAVRGSVDAWVPALSRMVRFFHTYFTFLPPLRFDFNIVSRQKAVVYTDASFSNRAGGLCIIVHDTATGSAFSLYWCPPGCAFV